MGQSPLTRKLVADGCEPTITADGGGKMGLLIGALRDIANDMPGVRAVHKRTEMRLRAERVLIEVNEIARQERAA
jgi:hypothetical protein